MAESFRHIADTVQISKSLAWSLCQIDAISAAIVPRYTVMYLQLGKHHRKYGRESAPDISRKPAGCHDA